MSQKSSILSVEAARPASPVVTLTPSSIQKIKSMMEREGKQGYFLRIGVVTGGCAGLSYELSFHKKAFANDVCFQEGDLTVVMNEECVSFLQGVEIDYVDTLKESGFKYRNPNAKSSCGCGTSFS